jgi:hypothetical protein
MPSSTPESLREFVESCQGLRDEKSDSQTFLNRFFKAFGYGDAIAVVTDFGQSCLHYRYHQVATDFHSSSF